MLIVKEDINEYNDKDYCNYSGEGGSDGCVGGVWFFFFWDNLVVCDLEGFMWK